MNYTEALIGIDISKERNAIAVAESLRRGGDVRYFGEVNSSEAAMRRTVSKIAERYDVVHFCVGAGDAVQKVCLFCRPLPGRQIYCFERVAALGEGLWV